MNKAPVAMVGSSVEFFNMYVTVINNACFTQELAPDVTGVWAEVRVENQR